MNKEDIRVLIGEKEQKVLFTVFLKKFNHNFLLASSFLGITPSSLSKYKRAVTRYIPYKVLSKIVNYLRIDEPTIIFSGTLSEIRLKYMRKAHLLLEQKYGKNWAKELTKRRDFKGICLEDFPDYLFIYLEESYRKSLFEALYNLFGSTTKAANFLKVSISRISCWSYGIQRDYVRNKEGLQFIPLNKLKLISRVLVDDGREEFSMNNIEKHITMYRMQAGNPINNPKFPIKESAELIRVMFHLLGDGYAGKKGENSNYKNTAKELLEEFKSDLQIFGDVPVYEQELSIKFPRFVADVLSNYYGIRFETFDSHISNKILQIPKKFLYFGIRAYSDDEGSVYSNSIRLSSANYKLLDGMRKILKYLKIRSNEVKTQFSKRATFGKIYYLDIRDIEKYNRFIGFTHLKKNKLLDEYVRKIKSHRRRKLLKT
jgi:transcriptional regulator with XRE-family HTH domain